MAKISEQSIEQIRNRADIVEIISPYVELKKRGRNFFGLCPFHGEKTASFSVNPEKQIFKCFGCGLGGSSIDFIMEKEKLDFVEAIRFLADQYGIEIEQTHAVSKGQDSTSNIYDMYNKAADIYQANLFEVNNNIILSQLTNRGISKDTIEKFKLGFSESKKDRILKLMQGKYNSKAMIDSNLFIDTKFGYMDRFRNRIMFTINNISGKIVAFAGRRINNDDNAKFINSPESQIYNKSKILYGLHVTKNEISKLDQAIVVEGYFDFLQLYQAGIKNVVAVCGTAFTDGHAHLIKRLTKNVSIAYDGDKAGVAAAIKAGYILLKNGLKPTIVEIPDGKDPDDWVLETGPEPFMESIKKSTSLIRFSFQQFQKHPNRNIADFINETLQELTYITDNVIVEINLKLLADCTGISFDSIYSNYLNIAEKRKGQGTANISEPANLTKKLSIEDDLLMLCFSKDKNIREKIYNEFNVEWMKTKQSIRIFKQIYIHLNSEFGPDVNVVLDQLEIKEDHQKLADIIFDIDKIQPTLEMANDCIQRLHHLFLKLKLEEYREKLKNEEQAFNENTDLINKIIDIQSKINSIRASVK